MLKFSIRLGICLVLLVGAYALISWAWPPPPPAVVENGPGNPKEDYFPCKILRNYLPQIGLRKGLSPTSLRFYIKRDGDRITTLIWARNAAAAIKVDWKQHKVSRENIPEGDPGLAAGQIIPKGMNIFGLSGKLLLTSAEGSSSLEWRKGAEAYALVLNSEDQLGFASASTSEPPQLESVVCVDLKLQRILGEVRLPNTPPVVMGVYDSENKVLIVADLNGLWVAMIDCSKKFPVYP